MTAAEIVKKLQSLGSDSYKRILLNHGAQEPVLGVKISELQKLRQEIGKDQALAAELYDTGIYDAQYLAGMIADEAKITKKDLARWVARGNCAASTGTIIAQLAAESPHGRDAAMQWIESKKENEAQAGWATLAHRVSITPDDELDVRELRRLLDRVGKSIHAAPNHVRYAMNAFLIAVGSYVSDLADAAIATGEKIGEVEVDMGNTACKVPSAPAYIRKAHKAGSLKKKRKSARC